MSHTQSMERIMAMRGSGGWGEELRTQKVCVVEDSEVLPGHGGSWHFAGASGRWALCAVLSSRHISPPPPPPPPTGCGPQSVLSPALPNHHDTAFRFVQYRGPGHARSDAQPLSTQDPPFFLFLHPFFGHVRWPFGGSSTDSKTGCDPPGLLRA